MWKEYFEIRNIEMLLDGGIDGVVHVQIRVTVRMIDAAPSLSPNHDPQS